MLLWVNRYCYSLLANDEIYCFHNENHHGNILALGRGEGNQGMGRSARPPITVVSLSLCRLGLCCCPNATPASPHEGSQTLHLFRKGQRGFALWDVASALCFLPCRPPAPSPSLPSAASAPGRLGGWGNIALFLLAITFLSPVQMTG